MYYDELSPAFERFVEALDTKKVAVIGHARPDGDCIGSQVALSRVLRGQGFDTICVNQDPVPGKLRFLCGEEPFVRPELWKPGGHVSVCVDCADADRPGPLLKKRFPEVHANVDHHVSNRLFARQNFIDSSSAATAEILSGMFFDNDYPIDKIAAQALYVGIATDTGQFRFPATSQRVFEICGRLLHLGADPAVASNHLYERETMGKMRLLDAYLSSLKLECDGRVCVGVLPKDIFEKTGAEAGETEGLVDYARSIHGVDIGVIIEDRGNEIKGSLRAKDGRYRVNDLAALFNGGGHTCAAGFTVHMTMEVFYPKFLAALREQFRVVDAANYEGKDDGGRSGV